MPLTFMLLQAVNAVLAAASLWIHFRNPALWDDQAIVFSTVSGSIMASLTAMLLGAALLFSAEAKWKSNFIHLVLTLSFAGIQGYLLYLTSRELGILQLLKSKLG